MGRGGRVKKEEGKGGALQGNASCLRSAPMRFESHVFGYTAVFWLQCYSAMHGDRAISLKQKIEKLVHLCVKLTHLSAILPSMASSHFCSKEPRDASPVVSNRSRL